MLVMRCCFLCSCSWFCGPFLMEPVELIKMNRELMGKCMLCYLNVKWGCGQTGRVSRILVHMVTQLIAQGSQAFKALFWSITVKLK